MNSEKYEISTFSVAGNVDVCNHSSCIRPPIYVDDTVYREYEIELKAKQQQRMNSIPRESYVHSCNKYDVWYLHTARFACARVVWQYTLFFGW